MKKLFCILMAILMFVGLCACGTGDVNSVKDINETADLPLIETLKFSVNDIVSNSKPEDLYYQICDVYLSPIEALTVAEFIDRAQKSSMRLTYNICEDDRKDIFLDYSDDYLVPGRDYVEIFFYCEEQLVFELVAKNLTDETIPLKNCYAFEINEMHEYFSKDALDVTARSWYCGGITYGGNGYTYTTIKNEFSNWSLECEEYDNDDGTLNVCSSVIEKEINVDFQNISFKENVRYYAVIDKSTGEVVKFYFR